MMDNRGQIFTTAFTIVVLVTLAIIVVTTIVVIVLNNSRPVEPNIIYLDENQSYINGTIVNITPIEVPKPILINDTPTPTISNNITTNCSFNNWPYPDRNCTPGARYNLNATAICYPGYSAEVRDVPESLKEKVYESYGIYNRSPYEYEIDHLIPLSIGGSNDQSNLWPEKYNATLGARDKDKVENLFHRLVCNGSMNLTDAQYHIVYNWTAWI